nr:hypothetical protein [Tanacetum cinerariifolium]
KHMRMMLMIDLGKIVMEVKDLKVLT